MNTNRLGKWGHKSTYCCPLKKCNYSSRIMFASMDNKISNHSTLCPKHRLKLVYVFIKLGRKRL